ncbi:MAG: hypothetical protein HQL95_00120 [Magnetococcales bacterium]|nr:hypothetical protein [Magnetococcales bacterium]
MFTLYEYLAMLGLLILIEGVMHILEFHAVPGMLVVLTGLVVAIFSSGPAFHVHLKDRIGR